jgi:tartrate dehydrogenase/decarboxylase/D-malate dehydrogenase
MINYNIAAIPADGIGPEVISAGLEVLRRLLVVMVVSGFR